MNVYQGMNLKTYTETYDVVSKNMKFYNKFRIYSSVGYIFHQNLLKKIKRIRKLIVEEMAIIKNKKM